MQLEGFKSAVSLPVPVAQLQKWNTGMCIFHAIFGIVVLTVGKIDLRVPIYASDPGIEVLANSDGWAYKPQAPYRVGWLYLTVLVASFSFLSAFAHLGNCLLWREQYIRSLRCGYAPSRWVEYCFSASIMVLILSYISGTIFRDTLILLFALTMITMIFGHLHEVICRPKDLDSWEIPGFAWRLQAHLLGYAPQIFAWTIIIGNFLEGASTSTTDSSGETRQMPNFVYAIVFGEMLIFWSFGIVQLVVSVRPPSKYYQGEIVYMWLSLFAKGFLALLCLTNVVMAGGYSEIYEDPS